MSHVPAALVTAGVLIAGSTLGTTLGTIACPPTPA